MSKKKKNKKGNGHDKEAVEADEQGEPSPEVAPEESRLADSDPIHNESEPSAQPELAKNEGGEISWDQVHQDAAPSAIEQAVAVAASIVDNAAEAVASVASKAQDLVVAGKEKAKEIKEEKASVASVAEDGKPMIRNLLRKRIQPVLDVAKEQAWVDRMEKIVKIEIIKRCKYGGREFSPGVYELPRHQAEHILEIQKNLLGAEIAVHEGSAYLIQKLVSGKMSFKKVGVIE